MVKEFAQGNGIDFEKLDQRTPSRRLRSSKHKLAYGVSIPCNPTVTALKTNIVELVQAGKLSGGEPCSPYTLRQMIFDDGKLVESAITVYGRKIPLAELRSKLLKTHDPENEKQVMRGQDRPERIGFHLKLVKVCESWKI